MKTRHGLIPLLVFLFLTSACGTSEISDTPDAQSPTAEVRSGTETVQSDTPSPSPPEPVPDTPTVPVPENVTPIPPLTAGEPVTITSIHMITELGGWAIGGDQDPGDHVLRTLDGGETWADVTPPEPSASTVPARKAAVGSFHNLYQAWVLVYPADFYGGEASVSNWWTEDGGISWTRGGLNKRLEINEAPPSVLFADTQTGWVFVESVVGMGHHLFYLLRSENGGNSWEVLADPPDSVTTCHHTAITFLDEQYGWMTSQCPFELAGGVFLEMTNSGGETWERHTLSPPTSSPNLFEQSSLCRTRAPILLTQDRGTLIVTCHITDEGTAEFVYSTQDGGSTWQTSSFPGGELSMQADGFGWAFGMEIFKTLDFGLTWERVKTVSWEGQFSFIDRERGWAVARAGEMIALVQTIDGGITWQELEPVVAPSAIVSQTEACLLSASSVVTAYYRPSLQAEPFSDLAVGESFYATARTAEGWIGFDPGYAQAANIGVFHHRWVQEGPDIDLEGDCESIPLVVGPPPGICFNMFMTDVPLLAQPLPDAEVLYLISSADYAMVNGKSADGWLRIDLNVGNIVQNIEGWVEGVNANFNGPCSDLPIIEP
ncbi:MAG TPA: hypothetical protein VMX56_00815 [Anaerolineales bacterium]|nr:hypothetical protein [Anaerolineales bacterium]